MFSHTARRLEGAQRREAASGARLRRAGGGRRSGKRGGDDRARTGDLSPDKRVLSSAELRPRRGKGRAASAARPFQLRGRDSNPRSRAHEAREDGPSSTALVWPAGVEPAISGARSRWGANSPTASRETPGGTRTRVSGLRARRHKPFDHGGTRLRRQGSNLRLASNSRVSYRLDHAGTESGRRGSRTPKAGQARPSSKRGTAPMAVLPVTPAGVEPATSRVRTGGSAELSYGASVLCGRQGSNLRRPAFQAGALPAELRPQAG